MSGEPTTSSLGARALGLPGYAVGEEPIGAGHVPADGHQQRPIVVAIHGIMTGQVSVSWPDKFLAWCDGRVDALVLKREYRALPLPMFNTLIKNRWLARSLANELELLIPDVGDQTTSVGAPEFGDRQRKLHFVSHSNGTHIALLTIKRLAEIGVATDTAIFVGSVLHPDVVKSGIAALIGDGSLKRAFAYVSARDCALAIPRLLPWCAYKDLGRQGFTWAGNQIESISLQNPPYDLMTRRFDRFGHGTYFDKENIEGTFELFREDLGL